MSSQPIPLQQIRVASPCHASWDEMVGDEHVRFCLQCHKNVYNLSAMEEIEAHKLVEEHDGRLCVRFYRRKDGTLLTQDCPVGLRRMRKWTAALIGAVIAAISGGMVFGIARDVESLDKHKVYARLRQIKPLQPLIEWLNPTPPAPPAARNVVMGKMCPPAP